MNAWLNVFCLSVVAMFACASSAINCESNLTHKISFFELVRSKNSAFFQDFYLPPSSPPADYTPSNWSYGAEALLHIHAAKIPGKLPVLEVGSHLVPFAATYARSNPWLVWERDRLSAESIANGYGGQATVFHVDTDRLNEEQWAKFMEANRNALAAQDRPVGLAAAILSSMLTVDNYQTILREVMGWLSPGSLLVITNSGLLGVPALTSNRITEFLFMYYGDRIEVLPGTRLIAARVGAGRPALQLAIQVKEPSGTTTQDLYREGLRLMANFSATFDERWYASRIDNDIHNATLVPKNSGEAEALRAHLEDPSRLEWFMPERDVLMQALEISNLEERKTFIRKRLQMLYRRLGHH